MATLPAAARQALDRLKQGPVQVMVDPDGTPIELFVQGGVEFNLVRGRAEANMDLIGVYDLYTTGDSAEFTLNLPETSYNVMQALFPDGLDGSTYMGFGKSAGQSMRADAKLFRFRPWQDRASATLQVELWLCAPSGDATQSMTPGEPWALSQPFRAFPDLTKEDGMLIGKMTYPARS